MKILVGLVIIFVIVAAIWAYYNKDSCFVDLNILNVTKDSPADQAGLMAGMTVLSLNGTKIESQHQLQAYLSALEPGQTLSVATNKGNFELNLTQHPNNASRGYLGVSFGGMAYDCWRIPILNVLVKS